MKHLAIILCALLASIALHGQNNDPIVGKWQNPSGEGRIEIFTKGDKFFGTLYWIEDTNKKDTKNPDKNLQDRKIQGLEILTGFVKDGHTYSGGEIYDPKSGKTYSCKMTLKGENKLDIRGYIGISLLGRTETWTRIK
ncbi:MAG: DUF2147 domain-containing protein [Sphingobacterium sp.]